MVKIICKRYGIMFTLDANKKIGSMDVDFTADDDGKGDGNKKLI